MSASKGSGAGSGGGGSQPIPAGSRKIVHSLKEIVNCSDAEIYAVLKECNMDPNEAVNRLLSQDPFHEVKSKREKRKEGKDNTESKPRLPSSNSSRGGKAVSERYVGRGGSTTYPSDSSQFPGKSSNRKENGSNLQASHLPSLPGGVGNGRSRGPSGLSDGFSSENKGSLLGANNAVSSGFVIPPKSYWGSGSGQATMADVLKMGRPHSNLSVSQSASHHHGLGGSSLRYPEDPEYKDFESAQDVQPEEEWPSMEKLPNPNIMEPDRNTDVSSTISDQMISHDELEAVRGSESYVVNEAGSESVSSGRILDDGSRDVSLFENNLYKNMNAYQQHQSHGSREVEEVAESVSSVGRNLQQLSVKDDRSLVSEEYVPSVVIPDHLQVHDADCSHLSFGSFGAGMRAPYPSGTVASSAPVNVNVEQEPAGENPDISSVAVHPETRSPQYYVDDHLRNASEGGLFHGTDHQSSVSQPEELRRDAAELSHRTQYSYSPSAGASAYNFDDAPTQTTSQIQNLSSLSSVMGSYTASLPSGFPGSNRESELQYTPFSATQSTSTKYGNSVSSMGVVTSAAAASEQAAAALKNSGFGTGVVAGPPPPLPPHQHLPMHPYSQPSLPLGPFPNVIPYHPFLTQSYAYMPSGFQQTFAGNSGFPGVIPPQYKTGVSSTQSASGYGGAFGSSTAIPGNFPMNHPSQPSATGLNYDDLLSSQYKDRNQLMSLLQNENPALWLHGGNSRTVPGNSYYNYHHHHHHHLQGNQQQSVAGGVVGLRQQQQQQQQVVHQQQGGSQNNYGGYPPNFYHSSSQSSEQQGVMRGDVAAQEQQPKQAQIWQGGY